jgi:hypothetical protein
MATSFSGGRSWREPATMGKQLVSFITCGCKSRAPFLAHLAKGHVNFWRLSYVVKFWCGPEMTHRDAFRFYLWTAKPMTSKGLRFLHVDGSVHCCIPQHVEITHQQGKKSSSFVIHISCLPYFVIFIENHISDCHTLTVNIFLVRYAHHMTVTWPDLPTQPVSRRKIELKIILIQLWHFSLISI